MVPYMVEVEASKINKIIGKHIEITDMHDTVNLRGDYSDDECKALTALEVIDGVCKLKDITTVGHPLGRGTIEYDCGGKEVSIRVHGDWNKENTYVTLNIFKEHW